MYYRGHGKEYDEAFSASHSDEKRVELHAIEPHLVKRLLRLLAQSDDNAESSCLGEIHPRRTISASSSSGDCYFDSL